MTMLKATVNNNNIGYDYDYEIDLFGHIGNKRNHNNVHKQ